MSDVNVSKIKSMSDGQLRKRAKQLLYHYRTGKFETVKDNAECPHVLAEYIKRLESELPTTLNGSGFKA